MLRPMTLAVLGLGALAACTTTGNVERNTLGGAALGAAAGALIGNAVGGGAAEGAAIGSVIGGAAGAARGQAQDEELRIQEARMGRRFFYDEKAQRSFFIDQRTGQTFWANGEFRS